MEAFIIGGLGMYPVLVAGLILITAAIRYAIDCEPIRQRFIVAMALVIAAMMLFFGVCGVVSALSGAADASEADRATGIARGLSMTINVWGLGLLVYVLTSIAIAIGVYRDGRRQLKAIGP